MTGLLVVDLDRTLVSVNSFTGFVAHLMGDMVKSGRWGALFRVIRIVGLRKMRRISHADAKMAIMCCCRSSYSGKIWIYSAFCDKLMKRLRPSVLSIIERFRNRGYRVALATAAPEEYAELIAGWCGFDFCIASRYKKTISPSSYECKGMEKLRRVKELCYQKDMSIAAVVTDHSDDIPLMKLSPECYLVNPSVVTERALSECGITYIRVD